MIKIQTISFGFKGQANAIEIIIADYKLGLPPRVLVKFYDIQEVPAVDEESEPTTNTVYMHEEFLNMPEEIYNTWGTDDTVVKEWVAEELDLTLEDE